MVTYCKSLADSNENPLPTLNSSKRLSWLSNLAVVFVIDANHRSVFLVGDGHLPKVLEKSSSIVVVHV